MTKNELHRYRCLIGQLLPQIIEQHEVALSESLIKRAIISTCKQYQKNNHGRINPKKGLSLSLTHMWRVNHEYLYADLPLSVWKAIYKGLPVRFVLGYSYAPFVYKSGDLYGWVVQKLMRKYYKSKTPCYWLAEIQADLDNNNY